MPFPLNPDGSHSGRLKETEKTRIVEAVAKKGVNRACEACGNPNWVLADHIVSPFPLNRVSEDAFIGTSLTGDVLASVALMCTNCGNTKLFNIAALELVDYLKNPEN